MLAALLPRIMPTVLGALLNVFCAFYFIERGENFVYLGIAHLFMVGLLAWILSRKMKAFREEQAKQRRARGS